MWQVTYGDRARQATYVTSDVAFFDVSVAALMSEVSKANCNGFLWTDDWCGGIINFNVLLLRRWQTVLSFWMFYGSVWNVGDIFMTEIHFRELESVSNKEQVLRC